MLYRISTNLSFTSELRVNLQTLLDYVVPMLNGYLNGFWSAACFSTQTILSGVKNSWCKETEFGFQNVARFLHVVRCKRSLVRKSTILEYFCR